MFIPTGNVTARSTERGGGRGHELLLKTGYVRQQSAGVYAVLPLGQRVLDKVERRLDDVMQEDLEASKVALPTLAPKALWQVTGRWESSGQELFRLRDRNTADFCLSPTCEESVTRLVAAEVNGSRQLPVRVYQVTRKFRDEMRPRGGLLRGKEFVMKDLYTFDDGEARAFETYEQVGRAYRRFFDSLGVEFLVAEADSGNIGGDRSHEYHLPSSAGEDTLLRCDSCSYVANQELARTDWAKVSEGRAVVTMRYGHQIYRDSVFFEIQVPEGREVNLLQLVRLARACDPTLTHPVPIGFETTTFRQVFGRTVHALAGQAIKVVAGDPCPTCADGSLQEVRAIEIGHTFHLGTKYSGPLDFHYTNAENRNVPPEMGCHGIGVTRLMAALAEIAHDAHGLRWPVGLAPFESVIVVEKGLETVAARVAAKLGVEAIDDRFGRSLSYRVKDLHEMGVRRVLAIGKRFWKNNAHVVPSVGDDAALDHLVPEAWRQLMIERVAERGDEAKNWALTSVGDLMDGHDSRP